MKYHFIVRNRELPTLLNIYDEADNVIDFINAHLRTEISVDGEVSSATQFLAVTEKRLDGKYEDYMLPLVNTVVSKVED